MEGLRESPPIKKRKEKKKIADAEIQVSTFGCAEPSYGTEGRRDFGD